MGALQYPLLASVSPRVKWLAGSGVVEFCDFLNPFVFSPLLVKIRVTGNEGEGESREEEGHRKGGKTDGLPKTRKRGSRMSPRLASEPIEEHVTLFRWVGLGTADTLSRET